VRIECHETVALALPVVLQVLHDPGLSDFGCKNMGQLQGTGFGVRLCRFSRFPRISGK
jgi:hypothetical protein